MSAWLIVGIVGCAVGAIGARRLVGRALWLAATSVLLAILLATLDAALVAVIEVSVGAGLVAVLFVFTVGIAGEDGLHGWPVVPKPLALALVAPAVLLLLWLTLPAAQPAGDPVPVDAASGRLADVVWNERAADVLGQVVLIVVAGLGVRTILGGDRAAPTPAPDRLPDRRAGAAMGPGTAGDAAVVRTIRPVATSEAGPSGQAGAREEART